MTATTEGQPRPGRLLVYLAIAAVSSLLAILPGLDLGSGGTDDVASTTPTAQPPTVTPTLAPTTTSSPEGLVSSPQVPSVSTSAGSFDVGPSVVPSTDTTLAAPFSWPAAAPPGPLREVIPPGSGVYLGAYVNTFDINGDGSVARVLADLPAFRQQFGRDPAIVLSYQQWNTGWVLNENLATIADTYGAIPMISWRCGTSNERIVSGSEDGLIFRLAEQLKAYGRPVMLRWFWEFNLLSTRHQMCLGPGTVPEQAARYVAAHQRIVDIFRLVGASNVSVAWVGSTASVATSMEPFYPGDDYVDWIGADGYSRRGLGHDAFSTQFRNWYDLFADRGKPMIVAETGATTDQKEYLEGIEEVVPRDFPQIKAIVYFDAAGDIDWRLSSYGGVGMTAFARLGQIPYFGAMGEP
jgi:hypothetical protein